MTREEWLETRRGGIGGSDISAIAGMNPWRSPLAVYLDKRGEIEDGPDNERMYWGRQLEDVVARHFAEVNNVKIRRVNYMQRTIDRLADRITALEQAGKKATKKETKND